MSSARPSRVRPTASRSRSRHAPPFDTLEIENVQENIDSGDEEEPEELKEPFSSGPYDISILCSFKTHIAADIWNQNVIFFCIIIIL